MRPDCTDAAWAAVRAADFDTLDRNGCDAVLAGVRRARSCLDTVEMRATRRISELAAVGASEAPESMLTGAAGHSGRDAKKVKDREKACDEMPDVEDALDVGDITGAHVDAIAAAARDLPDDVRSEFNTHSDDLLARAAVISLDAFVRECRLLAKQLLARSRKGSDADELEAQRAASKVTRWIDKVTGMHATRLELDPVRDAKLSAAINRELSRLRGANGNAKTPWQQLLVDATLNVLTGDTIPTKPSGDESARDDDSNGADDDDSDDDSNGADAKDVDANAKGVDVNVDRVGEDGSESAGCDGHCRASVDRVPEITVLIDYRTMIDRAFAPGMCETENGTPLPVSTVRRLCCDAEIIPMVLDGAGQVLDAGRSKRTATRNQRRTLRSMHRGCAHPGCTVGFDACRIHHIRHWWEHHGLTNISNLLPLCEKHHHDVHEGGWNLTMTPDRIASWLRPDGSRHHQGTTIDRVPWVGSEPADPR